MRKFGYKFTGIVATIAFGISFILLGAFGGVKKYGAMIFESEQDYKLKFVDSTDFLTLSESSAVILPFDILSAEEVEGGILLATHENAVILAPINCEVLLNDVSKHQVQLKSNNVRVVISGLISGVTTGRQIQCGEVIGTVDGDKCLVEVFWGERRLTLEELRSVL